MQSISTQTPRPAGLLLARQLIRWYTTADPNASPIAGPSRRRRPQAAASVDTDIDLIAPPDPASNIRPIIYASKSTRRTSLNSPYSTNEFPYSEGQARLEELELEWRLRRERVDMANHRFWATTNAEFNAQMDYRLAQLPAASDPPSEADTRRREDCLTQFYADWQVANRDKQKVWVREWWREVWAGIWIQGKVHIARIFGGRK